MIRRAIIALALLAGIASAAETPIPPAPTRWVTDQAGLITEGARAQLDARLERYQRATGHQVIVWIGTTLGGSPLEEWCANAFRAWGIGRKGKDDGVALFLFATDHLDRIEVGYGLEDKLPDAYASRILHEVLEPALQQGRADAGLTGAVDQILSRLGDEPGGATAARLAEPRRTPSPLSIVLGAIVALAFAVFAITHPRLALWLLWSIMSGGRGGGGGFGGGGGGFSGGGGRSGGGGASGSW